MKFRIPSSYGQIYFCAANDEDMPEWDDDSLEKGLTFTDEGLFLAVKNDKNIRVSIKDKFSQSPKFHYVTGMTLKSPDGIYEISSPDYTGGGILLQVEKKLLTIDIWVDSLDMDNVRSVIFVTPDKIKLLRSHFI